VHTADFLASLRNTSRAELDAVTSDNFFRLFDKASRPPG
jgi:Tat protein secretion system quality control protein TatD with DNase activity